MNRPVLRYFGGKFVLADWIISHFPKHRVYVEPFGGAGSVLLNKPRSYAEIYNDLDGGIVNFFRVLQSEISARRLFEKLKVTPFARSEFELAHEPADDAVEAARRMIIRSFMGFAPDSALETGKSTGFRSNSNRSGTTPAHDWANYPPTVLAACERLSGVVIENRDYWDLMKAHDGAETLFYLDPPYVHKTRGSINHGYNHEMTDNDHRLLVERLNTVTGMVILSGYPNPIYEDLRWARIERPSYADGARKRIEVLWKNEACVRAQSQLSFELKEAT